MALVWVEVVENVEHEKPVVDLAVPTPHRGRESLVVWVFSAWCWDVGVYGVVVDIKTNVLPFTRHWARVDYCKEWFTV